MIKWRRERASSSMGTSAEASRPTASGSSPISQRWAVTPSWSSRQRVAILTGSLHERPGPHLARRSHITLDDEHRRKVTVAKGSSFKLRHPQKLQASSSSVDRRNAPWSLRAWSFFTFHASRFTRLSSIALAAEAHSIIPFGEPYVIMVNGSMSAMPALDTGEADAAKCLARSVVDALAENPALEAV